MRKWRNAAVLVAALAGSTLATATPATSEPATATSRFVKVDPTRVLDTRVGLGAPKGAVTPGGSIDLAAEWAAPVPAPDVTAVVLNVTAVDATGPGFVQVYPTGRDVKGKSSNLNVEAAGQTIANLVVVPVGADGKVTLYSQSGSQLVADVFGFFVTASSATDGRYMPLQPSRLLDTRTQAPGKLPANGSVKVAVRDHGGVPDRGAGAVVLNVTAVDATNAGFLQVIPTGGSTGIGTSSNLNVGRGHQTIPNLVIVPIGADGSVTVYSQSGTDLIVDVLGYFSDATVAAGADGLFVPVTPGRVLDTRSATKPAAGNHTMLSPRGMASIPTSDVAAVFANVTATQAATGWVQVLPGDAASSETGRYSNVNVDHDNETIPNAAIANLGADGTIDLYTSSSSHLLVDVAGYFTTAPAPIVPAALSVAIDSPAAGVVSGNLTVSATTTGAGVLGVQFKLDGTDLGAEDTVAPYTAPWITADAPNGDFTLTAVVRTNDATMTSAPRTVSVSNAIVTLTFDDGWASQVNAATMMQAAGLHGSFFPISNFLSAPYVTVAQLKQIKDMGNEIGSHTETHRDLTTLSTADALQELAGSKATLETDGLGPINNFVSPYGSTNAAVRAQIATLYGSHRSIDSGPAQAGINYPADHKNFTIAPGYTGFNFDRYNLNTRNIFGADRPLDWHAKTTTAEMDSWLAEAKAGQLAFHTSAYRNDAWMILVFHEVTTTPTGSPTLPDGTPDPFYGEYNVQPALFQQLLAQIKASGVRVLTMQQALVETGTVAG